jgi:uncharacterized damage-inducible protein DinB
VGFLDYFRETMVWKASGLTEEQARFTPTPTANSMIGMISHLANVERWWFHEVFLNQPEAPQPWGDPEDNDWDFHVPADRTLDEMIAWYRAEWTRANEITAAADLDALAQRVVWGNTTVSMRWILVHMIEETARHAGHADITRELIDGSTGD